MRPGLVIQLVPCPSCGQPSLLTEPVSLEATLRCPACDETHVLGEALLGQYDCWQVVHDPAAAAAPERAATAEPADQSAAEPSGSISPSAAQLANSPTATPAWRIQANGIGAASAAGFGSGSVSGSGSESESGFASGWGSGSAAGATQLEDGPDLELLPMEISAETAYSRIGGAGSSSFSRSRPERLRQRQQGAPLWSLVSIALGGLAAFPIALLILWYGFGRDLGDLGPRIAQYAPWIVPQRFHPISTPAPTAPPPRRLAPRDALPGGRRPPPSGSSGFRQFDDVLPPAGSEQPTEAPPLTGSTIQGDQEVERDDEAARVDPLNSGKGDPEADRPQPRIDPIQELPPDRESSQP